MLKHYRNKSSSNFAFACVFFVVTRLTTGSVSVSNSANSTSETFPCIGSDLVVLLCIASGHCRKFHVGVFDGVATKWVRKVTCDAVSTFKGEIKENSNLPNGLAPFFLVVSMPERAIINI